MLSTAMRYLVTVIAVLAAHCAGAAGEHAIVGGENISNARWPDYQHQYRDSELCEDKEITLWTCSHKTKIYSLCSSNSIASGKKYIQYRAGSGAVDFQYPIEKHLSARVFEYWTSARARSRTFFNHVTYKI